jgi:predicted dehydrogenase
MEWQLRNWNYFTWLSGDHIVEQHVHNIDVINWLMQSHPEKAIGMGGRQQRTGPEFGHIYDHFAVEFEYPNGVRVESLCRQMKGLSNRVAENVAGTKGSADPRESILGANAYKYEQETPNPYVQEHADLINAIRSNTPINEGVALAESTMAGIMGRLAAYSGREISWRWIMNASKLDLTPPALEMGPLPVPPVAIPGEYELV